jgi:hypothetical protein
MCTDEMAEKEWGECGELEEDRTGQSGTEEYVVHECGLIDSSIGHNSINDWRVE